MSSRLGAPTPWALLLLLLLLTAAPVAASPPLLGVEVRVTDGVSMGGTANRSVWKLAAPTLGVLGEYAVMDRPRVSLYGEALFEGMNRGAFGLGGGVRLRPFDDGLRVGAGVIGMLTSYTHGGVSAMVGECFHVRFVRLCADVEVAMFFLGSDLPPGGVDGQLRLALSAGFDVL